MAKKVFKRKKEDVNKIRQSIKDEKDSVNQNLPAVLSEGKAAGSIGEVKSKSLYFKRWVGIQQQVNPLIGKHVESAPEYSTESMILEQNVVDYSGDVKNSAEEGTKAYNPEADTTEVEDLGKSPKVDHQKDKKFIDITIIENTTRRMISSKESDIEESCKQQMKSYHDNPKYETEMPIRDIMKEYKNNLIAKNPDKYLLSNDPGDEESPS